MTRARHEPFVRGHFGIKVRASERPLAVRRIHPGRALTNPAISELVVTGDGFVLAQTEGEVGANDLIGTEADLNRNLLDLIAAAGLTDEEAREFGRLQRERVSRYSQRRG